MASFIDSAFCGVEFGMGRSSWTPSIVPSAGDDQNAYLVAERGRGHMLRGADKERTNFERPSRLPAFGAAALGLIMAFPRKKSAAIGTRAPFLGLVESEEKLSDLFERTEIAAKQMRYFGLVARSSSFSEMLPSAKRAGFALIKEDTKRKEATFQWATGQPDFIFSVSFENPDKVSVVAESRHGDIFGLVLTGHSHVPNFSVETKPSLANHELGRNALRFRDRLLMFPDFDGMPAWTKY